MLDLLYDWIQWLLGIQLSQKELSLWHMCLRALIVYILGIGFTLFNKRFITISTPFDAIIRFIIGTTLASGITGSASFFSTLGVATFLVVLNLVFAALSFYSSILEKILYGTSEVLFNNGDIVWPVMKQNFITKVHLQAAIRKNANLDDLSNVHKIVFENDGELSVIPKEHEN